MGQRQLSGMVSTRSAITCPASSMSADPVVEQKDGEGMLDIIPQMLV